MDDLELLWEYGRSGANEPFARVAARYVDLVYSAALRQVRDRHVAEDVTQAVLIVLMNKGPSLRPGTIVPGWLLGVTRFAALDALKLQRRRAHHEREAAQMRSEPAAVAEAEAVRWDDVAPVVDEALMKLRTGDRDAVVLRYLLGKSPAEIAWTWGVSEEAARQRISRAMARLRRTLGRRGVTAGEAAIGSALGAHAIGPAPQSVAALAQTLAAPASGALGAPPALIARGATRSLEWGAAKHAGVIAACAIACVAIMVLLWPSGRRAITAVFDPAPAAAPGAAVGSPPQRRTLRTPAEIRADYAKETPSTVPRLAWAAQRNDQRAVELFLADGDDVNQPSTDGNDAPALVWAVRHQRDVSYEIVRLLLEHGADPNAKHEWGYDALMVAVRHRSPRTVELLLKRGASVTTKSKKGESALDWAKQEKDEAVLKLIRQAMGRDSAGEVETTATPSTPPAR